MLANAQPGYDELFSVLGSGAVAFSEYVERVTGHPATKLTAHCKGLDLPAWDPRGKRGNAMAYMTANVGASHMRAGYKEPTGLPNASAVDLMEELIESQNSIVIRDSMILCAFAKGATPDEVMLDAWNAITGDDASWDDLMQRASRQWDLARAWNVEHWNRIWVRIQWKPTCFHGVCKEPIPAGVAAGMVSFVDDDDEKACMEKYYALRGWEMDGTP